MKRALCGPECRECPVYIATVQEDRKSKEELAQAYSVPSCQFTAADMHCEGCRAESSQHTKMCGGCEIRQCGRDKDIETCAQCPTYPCEIIERNLPAGQENRRLLDELSRSQTA